MKFNLKLSGINFIDKIKSAFVFTWNNKKLWVLGFLLSLVGGAVAGNSSISNVGDLGLSFDNFGNYVNVPGALANRVNAISRVGDFNFFSNIFEGSSVILIIVGAFIAILFSVLSWYIRHCAQISLISASCKDTEGDFSLKPLWLNSHKYLLQIFIYSLLWIVLGFISAIAIVFAVILLIVPSLCCLGLPLVIVLLIFGIIMALLRDISYRLLVLDREKPLNSVKMAWYLIKTKTADLLLGYLFWFIPDSIISSFLLLITSFGVVGLGLIGILPLLGNGLNILAVIFGVILVFALYVIIALINAPVKVFSEYYLTNLIKDLKGDCKK